MTLSSLKFSLISLLLLSRQSLAAAETESSSVGDIRPPLSDRELELLDQKGLLPLPEPEIAEDIQPEPLHGLRFTHANGYRQAAKELGQLTEEGDLSYGYQTPSVTDTRRLRWNLGLSEEYSAFGGLNLLEERQWQAHRPLFEASATGRAYKGDGASLDEIFQDAYRLGRDFVDYTPPESSRIEGNLRLGDAIRIGRMSSLVVTAEARQDHYEVKDGLDEGSSYQAGVIHSLAAVTKDVLIDTTLKRSFVAYKDEKSPYEETEDINEGESLVIARVSPYYSAGLGFRTLDGKRNGPVATVIRRPDERMEAAAKVSYLRGEDSDQTLGSFRARYNATRLLSFTLNLEQGIDLLAAYSTLTVTGRTDIRQQRITKTYDFTTAYQAKYSLYKLLLLSNRQDYESSSLTQREARFTVESPLSPWDRVNVIASLRHYLEEGRVLPPVDRRQSLLDVSWKHFWSNESHLWGVRAFGEIGAAYERLWEGSRERERETFRIALGQEWE